jgi:hypothetical protein
MTSGAQLQELGDCSVLFRTLAACRQSDSSWTGRLEAQSRAADACFLSVSDIVTDGHEGRTGCLAMNTEFGSKGSDDRQ